MRSLCLFALTLASTALASTGCGGRVAEDPGSTQHSASPVGKYGRVVLEQFAGESGVGTSGYAAYFLDPIPSDCAPAAANRTCSVVDCLALPVPSIAPRAASAGRITFSGALSGPAFMDFDAASNVYRADPTDRIFEAGSAVRVSAVGAEVPPFTATVVAPGDLVLTCSDPSCLTIDRTTDLRLSWSQPAAGEVDVTFGDDVPGHHVVIDCAFDAAAGVGTIPASMLAHLPATSMPARFSASSHREVTVGDWTVSVQLVSSSGVSFLTVTK